MDRPPGPTARTAADTFYFATGVRLCLLMPSNKI